MCAHGPRPVESLVVGYNVSARDSAQRFWILQATFGKDWSTYKYNPTLISLSDYHAPGTPVGDGNGCIRVAMTNGSCGMYDQPAFAPNLGFIHAFSPYGAQPVASPSPPPIPPSPPLTSVVIQGALLRAVYDQLRPLAVPWNILNSWTATPDPCGPPIWLGISCGIFKGSHQISVSGLNLSNLGLSKAPGNVISYVSAIS